MGRVIVLVLQSAVIEAGTSVLGGDQCSPGARTPFLQGFDQFRIRAEGEVDYLLPVLACCPSCRAEIDAVCDDLPVAAAKTGMLSRIDVIEAVAERIRARTIPNLVVDPVMVAAGGDLLLEPPAVPRLRELMPPLAVLVTPNLGEAHALTARTASTP